MIARYGNKEVKNFSPLQPIFNEIKKEIKKEFIKAGLEWSEEYNIN